MTESPAKPPISPTRLLNALLPVAVGLVVALNYARLLLRIPDPFVSPDSTEYLAPALNLLTGRPFDLATIRTPGYPLFLYATLRVGRHLSLIMWAQAALALATAAITASLASRPNPFSRARFWLLFGACALFPWHIVSSHRLLTETLYTFTLILVVVSFFSAAEDESRARWVVCALATMACLFVRPVGLAILPAVLVDRAVAWYRGRSALRAFSAYLATVLVLSALWCGVNWRVSGFWGFTTFGGSSLFGSTAGLLTPEDIDDPHLAETLRPFLTQKRERFDAFNWVIYADDGPVAALRRAGVPPDREEHELKALAHTALTHHPVGFVRLIARHSLELLVHPFPFPSLAPEAVRPALDGFQTLAPLFQRFPELPAMCVFPKTDLRAYIAKIQDGPLYPFQIARGADVSTLCFPLILLQRWLPAASLLAAIFLLGVRKDTEALVLFLVIVFHAILAALGSDRSPRLLVPLLPVYVLIVMRALDTRRTLRR